MEIIDKDPHKFFGEENDVNNLDKIRIYAYEPAFGIIGDPDKRSPTTRQSADHSMVYIVSSLLRKAYEKSTNIK